MIDLSTDDGMRAALREIAAWTPPGTGGSAARDDGVVVPLDVAPQPERRGPLRWIAVAAAVVLVLGAAIVLSRPQPDPVPAARGTWRSMAPAPIPPRYEPAWVWTGTELIVWGGYDASGESRRDGAAYDPRNDTWRRIADFPFDHWRRTIPVGASGVYTEAAVPAAWLDGRAYFVTRHPSELWAWDLVAYDAATDRWESLDRSRFDQQPDDSLLRTAGKATIDGPDVLTTWRGRLLVTGWNSTDAAFAWATVDPVTGTWSDATVVEGTDGLYGFRASGAGVMQDRYLVRIDDRLRLFGEEPVGFVVDLVSGTQRLVRGAGVWAEEGEGIVFGSMAANGVYVGELTDQQGMARRFAGRFDPITGTFAAGEAPRSGPDFDQTPPAVVAVPGGALVLGGWDQPGTSGGLRKRAVRLAVDDDVRRWQPTPMSPVDLQRKEPIAVWTGTEVILFGGSTKDDTGELPAWDGARYELP